MVREVVWVMALSAVLAQSGCVEGGPPIEVAETQPPENMVEAAEEPRVPATLRRHLRQREEDGDADSIRPLGPVTIVSRGRDLGGWRFMVWRSSMGTCTGMEVGTSHSYGCAAAEVDDSSPVLAQVGVAVGGSASPEVDRVKVLFRDGSVVQAEPKRVDGFERRFFAVVPSSKTVPSKVQGFSDQRVVYQERFRTP